MLFRSGKTLAQLNFASAYNVHITSILRGKRRINIPGGRVQLFPYDKIQVIGTDEQLNQFGEVISQKVIIDENTYEKHEMILKQFMIDADSAFLGKTIKESGIRDKYHCFIAGVERNNNLSISVTIDEPFGEGDILWIVGEKEDVYQLVGQKN